jgi:hypothetical protein
MSMHVHVRVEGSVQAYILKKSCAGIHSQKL